VKASGRPHVACLRTETIIIQKKKQQQQQQKPYNNNAGSGTCRSEVLIKSLNTIFPTLITKIGI